VWLNTLVRDYDGTTVSTDKNEFKTKTLIWSAGVKGAPIKGLNARLTSDDRIIVDEFNRVTGYQHIFALGDVACIESEQNGNGHAMLASVAGQQGLHLGKNLNNILKSQEMTPFHYNDRGTMATIGRNRAVVDLSFVKFGGMFAWFVWMFLHLLLLVDFRNRLIVFANWCWSYFNYDKGVRLIVRDVKRPD
ncbi:MAG: FAD-dependent oxidoreductase, partial [Bacteroidetes bacterium]